MKKLLSCPFCSGEADCNNTGCQDHKGNPLWWVECLGCGISTSGDKDKEWAIAAWNRRTLSKTETVEPVKDSYKLNEPLTLEDLKQMDGEPLWVIEFSRGRWEIVFSEEEFLGPDSDTRFWYENYGTTWLAYRHKKEEGE